MHFTIQLGPAHAVLLRSTQYAARHAGVLRLHRMHVLSIRHQHRLNPSTVHSTLPHSAVLVLVLVCEV